MEKYERSIGLKTIWLTIIRRFEYLFFVFVPIAVASFGVTKFLLKKTYASSATITIEKAFSATNFEKFKQYVLSTEVMGGSSEKLQSEKGIGISADDIKKGLSFTTPATTSVSCTFTFQSSDDKLVKPVMEVVSQQACEYTILQGGDFAKAKITSTASEAKKNSSENKYMIIGIAAGLVFALGMAFVDEILSDEVYDKDDIESLGCEGFEFEASKIKPVGVKGGEYESCEI